MTETHGTKARLEKLLGKIWNAPKDAQDLIDPLVLKNASVFEFERELEVCSDRRERGTNEPATGPGLAADSA